MLAVLGGVDRMSGVIFVGRGYPDGFDVGVGAEFFDVVVGFGAVALVECFQYARIDVCRGRQLELRYLFHLRQDLGGADADADDAELELSSAIGLSHDDGFLSRAPLHNRLGDESVKLS